MGISKLKNKMSQNMKLVGYKFSATCQRVMATSKFANAPVAMENVVWGAPERETLKQKTTTGTFPYLETPTGVVSEAFAIIQHLAANFNEKLNGANAWDRAQVNQWVKVLDAHLAGKSFIVGNEITLADLEMFFPLRFYMQLVFVEETRNMIPNVVAWFSKLMVNPHIVSSYGRTVLCKVAQVAPVLPKLKLVGYKFSSTVQRILAVAKYANAPVVLENTNWGSSERDTLKQNTKTGTFPYLVTPHGNISEAFAITKYLLNNYAPQMMGESPFEKAQINQWVEYSHQELSRNHRALLSPIFGHLEFDKESSDKGLKEVKEFLKCVDVQLKGKKYLMGSKMTVGDLELFNTIRWYFTLFFPEEVRKNIFPNVTSWFVALAAEPQMIAS